MFLHCEIITDLSHLRWAGTAWGTSPVLRWMASQWSQGKCHMCHTCWQCWCERQDLNFVPFFEQVFGWSFHFSGAQDPSKMLRIWGKQSTQKMDLVARYVINIHLDPFGIHWFTIWLRPLLGTWMSIFRLLLVDLHRVLEVADGYG